MRVLEIDGVSKEYRLGALGRGTLQRDLQSWFARVWGKEDPNRKVFAKEQVKGEFFMALDDVSLSLNEGDALGILGRNGAGKSTLLKLISRITAPTKGEIRIKGRVSSLLEIGTGFHPELTGRENIFLNGAILGMTRKEISARLDEIIDFSEISQFVDTPVKRYSSGMYVKLAFAVAANLQSDILICDEVLAVGDVAFQQKCLGKMSDVARDGRAVIYVSHNMRTVNQLCSRAVYLDRGRLTYDGTVSKAIDLYAGAGVRSVERELASMPREKGRGNQMRLGHLTVTGTQDMEYIQNTTMNFTIDFTSEVNDSACRVRAVVISSGVAPVAVAHSAAFPVIAGGKYKKDVAFDLAGLAPGEYTLKLQLVGLKPGGTTANYDALDDVGRFGIADDPALNWGYNWNEPKWGNVRLREMGISDNA